MYRLSGRQILGIALGAALFAAVTAVGLQQLAGRFLPVGSAFSTTAPASIPDPSMASDEQNNIEIYRAVRAIEMDRARALQDKLTPLARAVTKTYGIGGLKAALEMIGYAGGAVRSPLLPASEVARAEIQSLLSEANDALSEVAFARVSEVRP